MTTQNDNAERSASCSGSTACRFLADGISGFAIIGGAVMRVARWALHKFDILVYWLAYPSICRICRRPGRAYFMELCLREWRRRNPDTPEVEAITEAFFASKKSVDQP